jgi:hypothetical protein
LGSRFTTRVKIAYYFWMKVLISVHAGKRASADHIESFELDLADTPRVGEEVAVSSGGPPAVYRVFDISWEAILPGGEVRTPLVRVVAST